MDAPATSPTGGFLMHRWPILALAALLALPVAAASPPPAATVAYTPDGVTTEDAERYYLKATLSRPEGPQRDEAHGNDCAEPERPRGETDAALRVAKPLLRIDPSSGTFSDWFPTCAAVPVGVLGFPAAYASYNVSTGRYYVEGPPIVPLLAATPAASMGYTGTTGLAVEADCVGCPPPTCC